MVITNDRRTYRHWQRGTLLLAVLGGTGLALVTLGFTSQDAQVALWIGILLFFLAFLFHGLEEILNTIARHGAHTHDTQMPVELFQHQTHAVEQ